MARIFLVVSGNEAEAVRLASQLRAVDPAAELLRSTSGAGGLALLEQRMTVPSLIFADFTLPDMNGIEFMGALRMRHWLEGVPVTILTGSLSDRQVLACYRLGACSVLAKPARLQELRETVRDHTRPARVLAPAGAMADTESSFGRDGLGLTA